VLRRISLTLTVPLSAAVPALAQDDVRETVVVTAAATPIPFGSVTRTLTVITRERRSSAPTPSAARST
jgi:outer membrane cobalamin receptor